MNTTEAVELIAAAIPGRGGTWADLGAGNGTFTRALARRLGPNSRIYAVDRPSTLRPRTAPRDLTVLPELFTAWGYPSTLE